MANFPVHDEARFLDGEGLTSSDLNEIGDSARLDAWDWPGYADLLSHVLVSGTTYEDTFASASGLDRMVFCKGGGPLFGTAGFTLFIDNGFFGIYTGTSEPVPGPPQMRWLQNNSNGAFTPDFTAAPSGQTRWDVVQLEIGTTDEAGPARDFKDAVTGALTTNPTPATRRRLRATVSVVSGAPAGADPAPPAATGHVIAMVLVGHSSILEVRDLTFPIGPGHTYLSAPARDGLYADLTAATPIWSANRGNLFLTSAGVGFPANERRVLFLPGPFAGDPTARLLGLELSYGLTAGAFEVYLAEVTIQDGFTGFGAASKLEDLTCPSGPHLVSFDLRGYPVVADATHGPYWGQGKRCKASHTLGTTTGKSLGLVVVPTANLDAIYWIKWYFAKG